MKEPVYFVGPTAVGKSELAIAFARQAGGEIVCADAFQLYSGLEVVSAAPAAAVRGAVPHHLFAIIPAGERFDVAAWLALATTCLGGIRARGRTPVVVGGSGLYVNALIHGLSPMPPADPSLRASLGARPLPDLLAELRARDPVAFERIDRNNPRRLVRALEVCILTNSPYSALRKDWNPPGAASAARPPAGPAGIILTREPPDLERRIARRATAMIDAGALDEIAKLRDHAGPTARHVIGFNEIAALLDGRINRTECIDRICTATRQYAKRQRTWFRNQSSFPELNLSRIATPDEASGRVAEILARGEKR